ncbi:hypothetical protein H4R35_006930 [Dimargaris xerosporica]|nr:hypothetical protein H4R35_006930 [Dimargaris xerosporica]
MSLATSDVPDYDLAQFQPLVQSWALTETERRHPTWTPAATRPTFLNRYFTRYFYDTRKVREKVQGTCDQGTLQPADPTSSRVAPNVDTAACPAAALTNASSPPSISTLGDREPQWQHVQAIWQVPSKMCVVGLAREHVLFAQYDAWLTSQTSTTDNCANFIARIDFAPLAQSTAANKRTKARIPKRNMNMMPKKVISGLLDPWSIIGTVTLHDGTSVDLLAGVRGYVVEINEQLATNPELLFADPSHGGYMAVVWPVLKDNTMALRHTLSSTEFTAARPNSVSTDDPISTS